jgi:hypothetical protein
MATAPSLAICTRILDEAVPPVYNSILPPVELHLKLAVPAVASKTSLFVVATAISPFTLNFQDAGAIPTPTLVPSSLIWLSPIAVELVNLAT